MKIMFNRTKTDSFQVGTFNEGKGELTINCPVWQFAKSNQLKLTIVEDEEIVEVITPTSESVSTQEGSTVPPQTEIPNNAAPADIPQVQETVTQTVQQPVQQPIQQPIQQTPVNTAPSVQQQVVQQAPIQQTVVNHVQQTPLQHQAQQVPPAFNPGAEGLNEIQQQVNTSAISVDKVNIKQALVDHSITEAEFLTILDMNNYGQFANIDAIPDEICKNSLENIHLIEPAILDMRKLNNA